MYSGVWRVAGCGASAAPNGAGWTALTLAEFCIKLVLRIKLKEKLCQLN
ncbi:MAG: hypothetical protein LBB23_03670 [Rickettsiales bacterium]|nr:hypothetical protein [Rickettsiales bacterium]